MNYRLLLWSSLVIIWTFVAIIHTFSGLENYIMVLTAWGSAIAWSVVLYIEILKVREKEREDINFEGNKVS